MLLFGMVSNVELFQINQQWLYFSVPLIEKPILLQLFMHMTDYNYSMINAVTFDL